MVVVHKDVDHSMDVSEFSYLNRWKNLGWTPVEAETEKKKPSAKVKQNDTTESV